MPSKNFNFSSLFLNEKAHTNQDENTSKFDSHLERIPCECNTILYVPTRWQSDINSVIVDAGASHIYVVSGTPVKNMEKQAPRVTIGTVLGDHFPQSAMCELDMPGLVQYILLNGYIVTGFVHNLDREMTR